MKPNLDENEIAKLTREISEKVHLSYLPIGFSLIKNENEIPQKAKRPSDHNQLWPVCLAQTLVRTRGSTIALTMKDQFCITAAAGLGHIALPDYLMNGKLGSHHTRNEEIGKKLQQNLETYFFAPESTIGIMLTPATKPLFMPQGVLFYGNPTQVGKICKGIAWYQGATVPASAGGIGGCIVAAWAAIVDRKPRVVLPCSGEKVVGHVEENEVWLSTPIEDLPDIVAGINATDSLFPYPTPKFLMAEPMLPKTYPTDYKTYQAWVKDKS